MHGESPYVVRGNEEEYKRLWYSNPNNALMRDITLAAGYGVLRAGTALALNVSAGGNKGKYVPYCPTIPDSGDPTQKGNAFILQDGAANAYAYVTLADSYKFVVGDDLIAYETGMETTNAVEMGAITAIDRTTYVHMAVITATSNMGTSIDVADSGAVHVECGADSSNGFSDCAGILANTVDTGIGEHAQGALAPMILSNAILYNVCEGLDAAALVDISGAVNGNLLVIK
jgi:hypothetical protein